MTIRVKRVYEEPSNEDGYRVLVDRLWPRGLSEDAAHVDLWMRDLAPSSELRKWFGHDAERWPGFQERYAREIDGHAELLDQLRDIEQHRGTVTLLFGARDVAHNQAVVLGEALRKHQSHTHH